MAPNLPPEASEDLNAYHEPRTVEDLTERNVKTIGQLEQAAKANRTRANRMADVIASFCGRIAFVWVHVVWFGVWVLANALPRIRHFDPYPFTFLTFVASLEAIFLSTFILISQNHETRLSERRSHLDLQVNLLTEQENTKMLRMLESIAEKVGANTDDDPSLQVLDQATNPEKLVEQIEQASPQSSTNPRGTTPKPSQPSK
jgi:uncharacterized membrane protein